MHSPLPSTDDLRAFVLVARLSGFTRAALQLQVPRSTVSTSIKRLEVLLGARLLQRTTRKVVLTHEGQELLNRSERLLDDFEEIAALFQHVESRLSGSLRVDVPLGMTAGTVMARLPEFLARHPGLQVDLYSTDRRVDVIADGFDCVVRGGAIVDDSLVCRPLGRLPLTNIASPHYVQSHGQPQSLSELSSHWLINYEANPSDRACGFEYFDGQKTTVIPMVHRITVNNSVAYHAACKAGLGIAQVPRVSVAADIAAGSIIEVLPQYVPEPMPMNLLYPHRRNVPQRVRLFGDWLLEVMPV